MEYPSNSLTRFGSAAACSGGTDNSMLSRGRSHPAQYCGVTRQRAVSDRFPPPRCQRSPRAIIKDPAGMVTFTASGCAPESPEATAFMTVAAAVRDRLGAARKPAPSITFS